jgi:hypothetical protein
LKSASILAATLIVLVLASISSSQDLPSSIRGYKVHRIKLEVRTASGERRPDDKRASVKVGEPRVVNAGLNGITFEATAEITGLDQNGQVDFLTFKDVVVNGIPLTISDYEHPFGLTKSAAITLPMPVRGTVSSVNIAKAAFQEATASRDKWRVTGTVFVFGRFRKMGFTFRRVIPVAITLSIPNPLKTLTTAASIR